MRVITKAPFGSSNTTEVRSAQHGLRANDLAWPCPPPHTPLHFRPQMILEAPNQRIKMRWLHAFRQEENPSGGFRGAEGIKLAEGYLTKMQPVGTTSKVEWHGLNAPVLPLRQP